MRAYLASCADGPCGDRQEQIKELPGGTVVSYVYRVKWVDPVALKAIQGRVGPLREGGQVWLCRVRLGHTNPLIEPLRKARIFQIKCYNCPDCDTPVFVRVDMTLLDAELEQPVSQPPAMGCENYLLSYW